MSDATTLGRRAPEQRQAAVVDAARELFTERGVAKTSVDAIAKKAGVAKGTVYLYFPTKEHIVRAIEEQFDERVLERLHAAASGRGLGATAAARAWCRELVEAYLDELDVHDLLFAGGAAAAREAADDDLLVDDLAGVLTDRADADALTTAVFLIGGVTAIVDRAIVRARTADRAELLRTVDRLATAALGATDPG